MKKNDVVTDRIRGSPRCSPSQTAEQDRSYLQRDLRKNKIQENSLLQM